MKMIGSGGERLARCAKCKDERFIRIIGEAPSPSPGMTAKCMACGEYVDFPKEGKSLRGESQRWYEFCKSCLYTHPEKVRAIMQKAEIKYFVRTYLEKIEEW